MVKRVITFLICCMGTAWNGASMMGQNVSGAFSKEYQIGLEWLKNHIEGASQREAISLELYKEAEEWLLYNDQNGNAFVLVATTEYWSDAFSPVLAWSNTNAYFVDEKSNDGLDPILHNFSKQLRHAQASADKNHVAAFDDKYRNAKCEPLLGNARWGQGMPYNRDMPVDINGKHSPVGCVPVAVSQILKFHKPQIQKGSSIHYKDVTDKIYTLSFDDWRLDWNNMRDFYAPKDSAEAADVSGLLMVLGLGVNARYEVDGTGANMNNVRPLLCNNFGFATSMLELYNSTDSILLSRIYQDLCQQRPALVSWNGHAFVVDGCDGCFLHYNMGWGGHCNGWYQPLLLPAQDDSQWGLIRSALVGIEPFKKMARTVYLTKPGTLASQLNEEEIALITHLRVSGKINGDDIRLLRKMAGCENKSGLLEGNWGNLMDLDLSSASIVKSDKIYLSEPASDTWTRTTSATVRSGKYKSSSSFRDKYDLGKPMDTKDWKEFCMTIGAKHEGKFYTREEDGRIIVHYRTEEDILGYHVFDHCISLKRLILPDATKLIRTRAIADCPLLLSLVIPVQVGGVQNNGITQCQSLERVDFLSSKTRCKPQNFFKCSPVFKKVVH